MTTSPNGAQPMTSLIEVTSDSNPSTDISTSAPAPVYDQFTQACFDLLLTHQDDQALHDQTQALLTATYRGLDADDQPTFEFEESDPATFAAYEALTNAVAALDEVRFGDAPDNASPSNLVLPGGGDGSSQAEINADSRTAAIHALLARAKGNDKCDDAIQTLFGRLLVDDLDTDAIDWDDVDIAVLNSDLVRKAMLDLKAILDPPQDEAASTIAMARQYNVPCRKAEDSLNKVLDLLAKIDAYQSDPNPTANTARHLRSARINLDAEHRRLKTLLSAVRKGIQDAEVRRKAAPTTSDGAVSLIEAAMKRSADEGYTVAYLNLAVESLGDRLAFRSVPTATGTGTTVQEIWLQDADGFWTIPTTVELAEAVHGAFAGFVAECEADVAHWHMETNGEGASPAAKVDLERAKHLFNYVRSLANWAGTEDAAKAMMLTLRALQDEPFDARGVRVGALWIDTNTLADPVAPLPEDRRSAFATPCPMADAATWNDAPSWYQFISAQMGPLGSEAFEAFLRLVGYSIFYDDEQGCVLWAHLIGSAGSGKTFFTNKLLPMLVRTAKITNKGMTGEDPFGLALLYTTRGARIAISEGELGDGLSISKEVLKNLTDGSKFIVRVMHVGPREISFNGPFWSDSNNPPKFGLDPGVQRRLLAIPFGHTFKGRAPTLGQYRKEAPAVLRLVFEAARRHRQDMETMSVHEAFKVPAEWLAKKAEIEEMSAPFVHLCNWLSPSTDVPSVLVADSVLVELIAAVQRHMDPKSVVPKTTEVRRVLIDTGRATPDKTNRLGLSFGPTRTMRIRPCFSEDGDVSPELLAEVATAMVSGYMLSGHKSKVGFLWHLM